MATISEPSRDDLSPIFELLDKHQYASTLPIVERLLESHPNSHICHTVKALALSKAPKSRKQCISILRKLILRSKFPLDDFFSIQTLISVCRSVGRFDLLEIMLEKTWNTLTKPESLKRSKLRTLEVSEVAEFGRELLFAYARNKNYLKQTNHSLAVSRDQNLVVALSSRRPAHQSYSPDDNVQKSKGPQNEFYSYYLMSMFIKQEMSNNAFDARITQKLLDRFNQQKVAGTPMDSEFVRLQVELMEKQNSLEDALNLCAKCDDPKFDILPIDRKEIMAKIAFKVGILHENVFHKLANEKGASEMAKELLLALKFFKLSNGLFKFLIEKFTDTDSWLWWEHLMVSCLKITIITQKLKSISESDEILKKEVENAETSTGMTLSQFLNNPEITLNVFTPHSEKDTKKPSKKAAEATLSSITTINSLISFIRSAQTKKSHSKSGFLAELVHWKWMSELFSGILDVKNEKLSIKMQSFDKLIEFTKDFLQNFAKSNNVDDIDTLNHNFMKSFVTFFDKFSHKLSCYSNLKPFLPFLLENFISKDSQREKEFFQLIHEKFQKKLDTFQEFEKNQQNSLLQQLNSQQKSSEITESNPSDSGSGGSSDLINKIVNPNLNFFTAISSYEKLKWWIDVHTKKPENIDNSSILALSTSSKDMIRTHFESLLVRDLLKKTENSPGDESLILFVSDIFQNLGNSYFNNPDSQNSQKSNTQVILLICASVLQHGLHHAPYNFLFKLLLLRIFTMLGSFNYPFEQFLTPNAPLTLDLKHIQWETLGYLMFYDLKRIGGLGALNKFDETSRQILKFFSEHLVETPNCEIFSYLAGSWTKILEKIKFRKRMDNSNLVWEAKTGAIFSKLMQNVVFGEQNQPEKAIKKFLEKKISKHYNCSDYPIFSLKDLMKKSQFENIFDISKLENEKDWWFNEDLEVFAEISSSKDPKVSKDSNSELWWLPIEVSEAKTSRICRILNMKRESMLLFALFGLSHCYFNLETEGKLDMSAGAGDNSEIDEKLARKLEKQKLKKLEKKAGKGKGKSASLAEEKSKEDALNIQKDEKLFLVQETGDNLEERTQFFQNCVSNLKILNENLEKRGQKNEIEAIGWEATISLFEICSQLLAGSQIDTISKEFENKFIEKLQKLFQALKIFKESSPNCLLDISSLSNLPEISLIFTRFIPVWLCVVKLIQGEVLGDIQKQKKEELKSLQQKQESFDDPRREFYELLEQTVVSDLISKNAAGLCESFQKWRSLPLMAKSQETSYFDILGQITTHLDQGNEKYSKIEMNFYKNDIEKFVKISKDELISKVSDGIVTYLDEWIELLKEF